MDIPKKQNLRLPKVPSYVKNVVKSFSYAATNKVKALAPSTAEFATTNSELYKDTVKVIRDYKTTLRNVGKLVQGSDIYDATNNIFKNAMDDLRTGNFINKSRENAVMDDVFGGDDFDFDIGDGFDNSFDSSDSDSSSSDDMKGFENVARVSVKNANQISDAVKTSTGAMVSTVVQNQRDIANHQFMISQAHFNETMGRMEGINNTLVDVGNLIKNQLDNLINPSIQFYTDAMGKLEEITGYTKEMAAYQKNLYDAKNKELQATEFKEDPLYEMFGANGGLDLTRYARTVMDNMNKEFTNQSMGMFDMFGGPSGFMRMLSASPLSFIPNTLVQLMIPVTFNRAVARFDKSLSGFFSSLISKFTEWQDSQSPILRMIGKFLGVKAKDNESVDLGQYNVETGSLDKMTHRTINTVIPTYLRQIVDLLGGRAKVFDHTTGTFNDLEKMRKNYNESLDRAAMSGLSDISDDINKRLDMILENVKDAKQVKRAKDDAKEILKKMSSRGHIYSNFGKMNYEDFENTMGNINLQGGEQSFKLFASVFNSLPKEMQLQLAGAINESRFSKRNVQQTMIREMYSRGYNSLFDGSAEGKYTTNANGKVQLAPLAQGVQDKFFTNAVDYLRDIKGILLRGIRVFTSSGSAKGKNATTLESIEEEYRKFRNARTATQELRIQEDRNLDRENERREKEIDKRIQKKGGKAYDDISDLKIDNSTSSILKARVAQQEELDRKAAEEGSIMYQMFGDTLIYSQVKNVKKKFEGLAEKPFSLLVKIADKASDMMHQVIFGEDPNTKKGEGLLKTLKKAFDEKWRKLTDWFQTKLFNPIKEFFMGSEDKEGLFSKINNTIFTPLTASVSNLMGVDIGDLDLNSADGKKEMRARMKAKVGEFYKKWNLGSALKGAGIGGALGGLFLGSPLIGSVMGASAGFLSKSDSFQKFLFGDLDENGERMGGIISKDLGKQLKTKSTQLGIGAGLGALLGTGIASFIPGLGLLGSLFTPFGAIGGALTGFGLSIAGTSDKFKNWLLGDLDEKGERMGGVISKSLSNNLGKTILKGGIGGVGGAFLGGKLGALVGLGMSFIPGLGLLGSVMGPAGAIGGALMGMGLGIASSTDTFQTMLFGEKNKDGIRDKGGLFDKEFRDKFVKLAPKAGISALVGGLTMGKLFGLLGTGMSFIPGMGIFGSLMGPAGIIGGSLLGLGLSITSSGQDFKDRLLGKVKGKEGEKSLFDKMEDFIGKNILNPMKDWANKTAISIKGFFEESISVPFKAAMVPLRHEFQLMTESMKDLFKSAWKSTTDAIGNIFEEHVGKPFGEVMEEKVLKPLKSWIGKLVGGIGKFFGGIISAPIKALTSISQGLYSEHVRKGVGDYGDELGDQRGEYESKVSLGDRFAGTVRKFMKTGKFADTMDYGKEQVKGLGKGIGNYFGKKGKAARDKYNALKDSLGDATLSATLSSLDLFGDAFGRFADFLGRMSDKINTDMDNREDKENKAKKQGKDKEPTVEDLQEEVIRAQATIFAGYSGGPHETIKETLKNIRKMNKDRGAHKAGWSINGGWQKGSSKDSSGKSPSSGNKEADRKSSKYKNIPLDTLQRTTYGKLIDNLDPIKDGILNIKKNVDGQLDGVGDNINRIRKMLAQAFDDVGGSHDGNKQRKSLFSKMVDFISSPFKFVGKLITTAVTAPIKILSSVVEGLVTTAIEGVKTVSTLARTAISTIGSIAKASMGLVSGLLKGFGHVLAGAGKVAGSALEFIGKTAVVAGGVIRDTFVEGLKLAGSAAKTFGSAMISAAGIVLDGVTGMAKLAWKGIKGIGKLGLGFAKGAFNFATGAVLGKKGLTGGMGKEVQILGGVIDNIKDITFFDNFTIKTGAKKSALRVVVENFEDAPGGVNDNGPTSTTDGDSTKVPDTKKKVKALKQLTLSQSGKEESEEEGKENTKNKPIISGMRRTLKLGWSGLKGSNEQATPVPPVGIPGLPALGWNGVSSPVKGDAKGFGTSSLFPMIGWNGKTSEPKKDTTSATARLGMKETALAKRQTAEVATDINDMSTALVSVKDRKIDALRVRIVDGKDEKDGGIVSTITKFLPKAGITLASIVLLLEGIKSLIPDIKSKDFGNPGGRIAKNAIDMFSKTKKGKVALNAGADALENIAKNPEIITESRVGRFVGNVVNKAKNSKLGKMAGDIVEGQVDNIKTVTNTLLDLTDEKNVLKILTDTMTEFFVGIAEKLEKAPIMKKVLGKIAKGLRAIGPGFVKLLQKVPKFMGELMGKMSAKGAVSVGAKTLAKGMRMLAKKFFPLMAFIEGYTQADIVNATGKSTFLEKMIGGLTMAILDCIQAITMVGGTVTAGSSLILTGIMIVVENSSSYWLPGFTSLMLKSIDSVMGTKLQEDYKERQKKVDDEYNAYRKNAINKVLDEEYAKAQEKGYEKSRDEYYNENIENITSKVKSKSDYIKDAYDTKYFSLVEPSTWKNLAKPVTDALLSPLKLPFMAAKAVGTAAYDFGTKVKDKGKAAVGAVTGAVTALPNKVMESMSNMKKSITDVYTNITKTVSESFTATKDSLVEAFKSTTDSIVSGFTNVKDSIVGTFTSAKDALINMKDSVKELITSIPEKFSKIFTDFKESLFDKFKAVINFKDTFVQAIQGSFKTLMEHPLSPFKLMNDFVNKVNSFLFGTEDNPTLLGVVKNGITSILPDWMKPSGRGKDDGDRVNTQQLPNKVDDPKKQQAPKKFPMPNYQVFSQTDSRWGNMQFNTGELEEKFSKGGCAPTVMATLLNTFAGKNTDPGKEAENALKYAGNKGGIQLDYFKKYGATQGLNMGELMTFGGDFVLDENLDPKGKMTSSLQGKHTTKAIQHLRQNKPLIGLVEDGRTKHYMIATHMDDKGMIHIIDPSDGKKYSMAANKFFKAVKYGYLLDPNKKTTDYEGQGFLKSLKSKGLDIGSAFVRAVTNLVTKGIFSYDDLSLDSINSASSYGEKSNVKGVTGTSFTFTPTISRDEAISRAKQMMASAPHDSGILSELKIGEMPDNMGGFKIGQDTIVENGQVVQFPEASIVGKTKDGRPVFFVGTEKGNEFGLRYNYGNATPEQYAKIMAPYAKEAYTKRNLRPDIAMVQSGHETGWGKFMRGNIAFNLKYLPWQNSAPIIFGTREGKNSEKYRIATFANFPSMADAWLAHQSLLSKDKYKGYLESQWADPNAAIDHLLPFADDGRYVQKLKDSYAKYGPTFQGLLGMTNSTKDDNVKSPFDPAKGELADELTGKGIRIGGLDNLAGNLLQSVTRPLDRAVTQTVNSAVRGVDRTINRGIQSVTRPIHKTINSGINSVSSAIDNTVNSGIQSISNVAPTLGKVIKETGLDRVPGDLIKAASRPVTDIANSISRIDARDIANSGIDAFAFGEEQIRDLKEDTMRNINRTISSGANRAIDKIQDMPSKAIDKMGDKVASSIDKSMSNMDVINSGQGNQIVGLLQQLVDTNVNLFKALGKFAENSIGGNNIVNKGGNTTVIANGGGNGGGISPNSEAYSLFNMLKQITQ